MTTATTWGQPPVYDEMMLSPRALPKTMLVETEYLGRTIQVLNLRHISSGLIGVLVVIDPRMATEEAPAGLPLGAFVTSTVALYPAPGAASPAGLSQPDAKARALERLLPKVDAACRAAGYLDDDGWRDLPGHPGVERERAFEDEAAAKAVERARDGAHGGIEDAENAR